MRNINQQYRHSSMGILLAFAPALITAALFAFGRRSHLLAGTTGGVNSAFFSVVGVLLVQAFLEAFQSGRRLFANHQGMLRRQPIPVEAPMLAALLDLSFHGFIRLGVMAAMFGAFSVAPRPTLPLALWGLFGVTLGGFGVGTLLAVPAALHQDTNVLSAVLPLILFTVTPVFGIAPPESFLGWIQRHNPLAWWFDGIRVAAYGGEGTLIAAGMGPVVGCLLLLLGWLVCRIARPHVAEKMLG